ncbi:MAG: acetyl/propionyl/methylcrotonyl-CoA carboxylase subunit alpha [Idiomarina sp.]|nr:acetyl/propionyl/methylcrotonyl-CoA carboxylase subunit alpha [Idiomarina sp.]
MLTKVLIANRGEIACRIIASAKEMGIQTVAVYSDADRHAQHVLLADEAIHIGPSPSGESYLRADKIIEAARTTGADAVHPGYGFLSENEGFAQALQQAGLIFVGPPIPAITAMGSKSAAKTIMAKAGVPLVPGYHGDDQSDSLLAAEAEKIGYPVLLKAAYGGGGKGMRIVNQANEFDEALASARREAKAAFSNDKMLVEKYIRQPRHVEIQVFCDSHGNALYLAERDCSVQRRHQKVIEEAPAPGLSDETRKAMGEAAVRAAQAIDYEGAGTVEFLLDADENFYFMEMNTRLQVEHPVTEMITGIDLVNWQLRVAAGEALPLSQEDVEIDGHAFEARIYAEDASDNFMPSTGTLEYVKFPPQDAYIRVDSGVIQGNQVSTFYDPMIAKLIVWGETREEALSRLKIALRDTRISGLTTNIDYLHAIARHPEFAAANVSTHFIEDHGDALTQQWTDEQQSLMLRLVAARVLEQRRNTSDFAEPWETELGWQTNARNQQSLQLSVTEPVSLTFTRTGDNWLEPDSHTSIRIIDERMVDVNGRRMHAELAVTQHGYTLFTQQGRFDCHAFDPLAELAHEEQAGTMTAPMNGTIVAVSVAAGDAVKSGQALIVMEAMKMEYTIRAPLDGVVEQVFFGVGDLVSDGAELVALAIADSDA